MAYVNTEAAVLLRISEAVGKLKIVTDQMMADSKRAKSLGDNIKKMAKPKAAEEIVEALESILHESEKLHTVHFLGIGGIGMSALARWFNHIGVKVSGYDKTTSPLTASLEEEGREIGFEDSVERIPERVLKDKDNTLIVWTPAMPKDSVQLNYLMENGFPMKKRAAVLGMITANMPTIAVAGTHGKTTTSSMIAHLLKFGGKNIAAFLGGLTQNYESSLILHDEAIGEATVVVEADEFDRSFLHLQPNVLW